MYETLKYEMQYRVVIKGLEKCEILYKNG